VRARRGLLTRWELAVGVVLALATAAWVRPRLERATWRTRRAEAELVLESLAEHGAEAHRSTGRWPTSDAFPRAEAAVDRDAVPWSGGPDGWTPPLEAARCAYRVERGIERGIEKGTDKGIEGGGAAVRLVATCDVDGDGVPSVTTLVPGAPAVRATPEDVY
jgi:hypothetical protein